ncbi:phage holin family protein [Plesiomonas shigelloides subsp. oncorhynchi]|nr:phage holin family protein [Plesiomonas shigelloides]
MYATGCPLTRRHDAREGYMPEKDPSIWAWLCAWVYQNAPTIYSFCLAFAIAAIRVLYGGGTKRTMILEGALWRPFSFLCVGNEVVRYTGRCSSVYWRHGGFYRREAAADIYFADHQ